MAKSEPADILAFLPVVGVFDYLTNTVFFAKDLAGRYVAVNRTLAARVGCRTTDELIGRTPSDILGERLGRGYEAQDRMVASTGTALTHQLELHAYANGKVGWCMTNKRPVHSHDGTVIGVVGVSQDLRPPNLTHDDVANIAPVLDHVNRHPSGDLSVATLSRLSGMSAFQLDRRIRNIFGLTTGQWVLKTRLELARRRLTDTDAPIAEIALDCGYGGQSSFTRQFRKTTGLTPTQFREAGLT